MTSYFDLYLRESEEITRTEEAFIRRDLYIAKEKKLKGYFGRVHALVIAEEDAISDYLANAEVASHLYWNGSEEKLVERYRNPATLRAVRYSARRLLDLLQGSDEEVSSDLLLDVLSIPSEGETKAAKRAGGRGKTRVKTPKVGPIQPSVRYHQITDGAGVRVGPGSDAIPPGEFPVAGTLEVAYENLAVGGNAFSNYHPFDFDLSDLMTYKAASGGLKLLSRSENKVTFSIEDPDWFLEISGFDPNKPIRARATLDV